MHNQRVVVLIFTFCLNRSIIKLLFRESKYKGDVVMQTEKSGVLWAIGSYLIWGVMPIYWKSIEHVTSAEILVSRIVWAFILTFLTCAYY